MALPCQPTQSTVSPRSWALEGAPRLSVAEKGGLVCSSSARRRLKGGGGDWEGGCPGAPGGGHSNQFQITRLEFCFVHSPVLGSSFRERDNGHATVRNGFTCWSVWGCFTKQAPNSQSRYHNHQGMPSAHASVRPILTSLSASPHNELHACIMCHSLILIIYSNMLLSVPLPCALSLSCSLSHTIADGAQEEETAQGRACMGMNGQSVSKHQT